MKSLFVLSLLILLSACSQPSFVPDPDPDSPLPPTLTITSPGNGSSTDSADFTVTGFIQLDNDTNLVSLSYSHNGGSSQSLPVSETFSFNVTLVNGYNTIQITVTDSNGNNANATFNITYDKPTTNPSTFNLSTSYPSGSSYFVAQGSDALYKVTIGNRSNFTTDASSFSSVSATGGIIGTTADKVRLEFLKSQSSGDDLYFALVAGSSVPVGTYSITITAQGGGVSGSVAASVQVLACSFGCN